MVEWNLLAVAGSGIALPLLLIAGIVAAASYLINARCRSLIDGWASHGAWEVVRCRRCLLRAGPFAPVPGMPIYHVELQNRFGRRREAYVRCGNVILSVLADDVAVAWVR